MRFGLRAKQFLAFGIVLLPVLVLLIAGFQSNLAWRESLILDEQRRTAEAVAIQVDGAFDASIGLGWAVANDPLVQTLDPTRLDPHLKQLMERYPFYQEISVFDAQGLNRGYGHLTQPPEPRMNIVNMPYFQSVMGTNAPVISPVIQLPRPGGIIGIVAAVPIRNGKGGVIGVVTVAMTIDQLAKRYEETRLLPGQAILLADRTAHVAFHSLRRDLSYATSTAFESLEPLRAALAGLPTTAEHFTDPVTNDLRLGAFVPTLRYHWVVGVTMSPAVALMPVYSLLRQQLGLFTGILLLSAILATLMARYIVRPFLRLDEAALALGRGDLSRRVDIRTGDEIEHLGASFNEMAIQLEERDKALREREARIRRLVESNIIGIFMWNVKGAITDANDAFIQMLGYTREDLLSGKIRWSDITPPEYRFADEHAIEELVRTSSVLPYDKEYVRKDGRRVPVMLGAAFFEGSQENGVAFVLDVTERKQAEIELKQHRDHLDELVRERTAELRIAKEAAEAGTRVKSVFLASMSHELRTPLNAVLGYAQILKRDKGVSERQAASLNIIEQSGKHLLKLINDVLDLSKIEAGKLDLYPGEVNLPAFLRVIVETIRVKTEEKSLSFNFEASSDLPHAVHVDDTRLRQVLLNLLGNAVKFTDRGQVSLRAQTLRRNNATCRLRFEIEDTGIGIAANQVGSMFQLFEQVGDVQRHASGAGLGLAISRQLIRLMGSDIQLESEVGRGSRFWFDLDLQAIDIRENASHTELSVTGYQGGRRKILVIDDVPENRALLIDFLSPFGFEMIEAENGQEGIDKAEAKQPDLILMDIVMPVMDGLEATRRLREIPAFKNVPIIAISASASHADEALTKSGANAFLSKPTNLDSLMKEIGALLHLTWNDEQPPESGAVESPMSKQFIPPPYEEMELLHRLALFGDMRAIRQHASHIAKLGEEYRPFTEKLNRLAERFQSEAILHFVEEFIDEKQ